MATLLLQPQEAAIKQLFSRGTPGYFPPVILTIYVAVYFCATAFIYGIAVPSGLFVPCMLIGGGLGRLVGELFYSYVDSVADPGLYALMGAAAVLAGVTHMTMSLAMIIVEVSGDLGLVMPMMLVILTAKIVAGKIFDLSVYDMHLGLAAVPMLNQEDMAESTELLNVKSVMATRVRTLREADTVETILLLLERTTHQGFPIVAAPEEVQRVACKRSERRSRRSRDINKSGAGSTLTSSASTMASAWLARARVPAACASGLSSRSSSNSPVRPRNSSPGGASILFRRSNSRNSSPGGAKSLALPAPGACRSKDPVRSQAGLEPDTAGARASPTSDVQPGGPEVATASKAKPKKLGVSLAEHLEMEGGMGNMNGTLSPNISPGDSYPSGSPASGSPACGSRSNGPTGAKHALWRDPSGGSEDSSAGAQQKFCGLISRDALASLLSPEEVELRLARLTAIATQDTALPVQVQPIPSALGSRVIDLRPHCDRSPFMVHEMLPLRRAARLFVNMGLRHLVVVDDRMQVKGLLTRKDFLHAHEGGLRKSSESGAPWVSVRKRREEMISNLEEQSGFRSGIERKRSVAVPRPIRVAPRPDAEKSIRSSYRSARRCDNSPAIMAQEALNALVRGSKAKGKATRKVGGGPSRGEDSRNGPHTDAGAHFEHDELSLPPALSSGVTPGISRTSSRGSEPS